MIKIGPVLSRIFVALVLCVALMLPGCSSDPGTDDDPDTLRIVVMPWMMKKFPFREAAKRFEAEHPGKKIEFLKSPGDINTMIFDWDRGKTRVDLVVTDTFSIMQFIKGEYIVPLDDMFDNEMPKSDFLACFLGDFEYDGKVWGLPFFGEVVMLGYRRDLLAAAEGSTNVTAPATYPELGSTAASLTRRRGRQVARYGMGIPWDGIRAYLFLCALASSRGAPKVDDDGNLNLLSDEYVESLEWICGLVKDGVVDASGAFNSKGVVDSLNRGTTVFAIAFASWAMQGEEFMGDKLALGVLPGSLENGSTVSSAGYSIIKYGRVELAKTFLREHVMQKYFQNYCAKNYKKSPTRKSFYADLKEPYWKDILRIGEASKPFPRYVDTVKMGDVVSKYVQEAWLGNIAPEEALRKAYEELQDTDKYKR